MTKKRKVTLFFILMIGLIVVLNPHKNNAGAQGWRNASQESVGLAPDPAVTPEAVIQVYTARTWGWRGYLGVHPWIAVKPSNAEAYTVYEVIGWRLRWGEDVVAVRERPADARWFGNAPELLADMRGDGVDAIIKKIDVAARSYPYGDQYTVYPGPNSNTFVAHVAREVPELKIDLPPTAIGKDYLGSDVIAKTPSGTGYQISLGGLFGVMASAKEGLEINILGLVFGINPLDPSIKLPGVGRIGPARKLDYQAKVTADIDVTETRSEKLVSEKPL
jgi:hypothetical protein